MGKVSKRLWNLAAGVCSHSAPRASVSSGSCCVIRPGCQLAFKFIRKGDELGCSQGVLQASRALTHQTSTNRFFMDLTLRPDCCHKVKIALLPKMTFI